MIRMALHQAAPGGEDRAAAVGFDAAAFQCPVDAAMGRAAEHAAFEQAFGTANVADAAAGGLRGNIMRTPWQRQQNFALEGVINEAAAAAGADPIAFRIRHTTNVRLVEILKATADDAGWKPRPSTNPEARRTGNAPVKGRGVGVIIRSGAQWVGIAEVEVTPATGVVKVTALTVGVLHGGLNLYNKSQKQKALVERHEAAADDVVPMEEYIPLPTPTPSEPSAGDW